MEQFRKFRVYDEKNQRWVYGYYFINRQSHYIVEDGTANPLAKQRKFEVVGGTTSKSLFFSYNLRIQITNIKDE